MSLTMMDLPVGNSGHPHPLMHMVCLQLFRHNDCTKACKQMNLNECIKSMSDRDRYLMDSIFYEGLMIGQNQSPGELDSKYVELCKNVYPSYEQIVSKVHSEIAAFRNYFENKTLEPLILLLRCIYRRFPHLGPLMYSHFTSAAEMALSSMTQDSLAEWCQTFKSRRLYLDSADNFARRDMQLIVKSRLETPESALQMILEDMQAERKYDDFVVPDKATAASIIGRLGERVMKLRNDHCCYIESPPADTPEDGPRHFRITGPKDNRERVIKAMHEIVQRHRCSPNGNGSGSSNGNGISSGPGSLNGNGNIDGRSSVLASRNGAFRDRLPNTNGNTEQFSVVLDEKFWVRRSQCGLVIGTNGATVRAIQELTHTVIQSPEKPREPPSLEEMACFRVTYRIPKDGSSPVDQYSQSVREHARASVNRAIAFMIIYIQHTNQHSNTDVTALVDEHYSLIEHMSDEEKERLYEEVHLAQAALGQRDSVSGTEMRTTRASRQIQQNSTTQAQSSISTSQPPSLLQQQQHFFSDFRSPQSHVQQLQRQKQRQLMLQQHHTSHNSNGGQPESLMHCDFSLPDMPMSPARSVGCLESRARANSSTIESWSLLAASDRISSSYRSYDQSFRDHHSGGSDQPGSSMRQRCASGNIIFGSSHSSTNNSGFNPVSGFSGNASMSHCSSVSRLMGVDSNGGMLEHGGQSEGDILGHAPTQSRFFTLGNSLGNNVYKSSMNGNDFENHLHSDNGMIDPGYKQWIRSDTYGQHLSMSPNSRQDSRWRVGYPGISSSQQQVQHQVGVNSLPMGLLPRPVELQLQADEACSNPLGGSDMPSPSVLCPLMKDLNTDDHFGPPINGYSSANGPWTAMSAIGSERKLSISENSDYHDCKFSIMDMSTSTEGSSRKENSPDRELEMQDFASQYRERTTVDGKDADGKTVSGKNGIVCPP